jgi:hypothetical protein
MMRGIMLLLKLISVCVMLALWATIGFLIWIPLIHVAMALVFIVHVLSTLYDKRSSDTNNFLTRALEWWPLGFSTMVRAVFTPDSTPARSVFGEKFYGWPQLWFLMFIVLAYWACVFVVIVLVGPVLAAGEYNALIEWLRQIAPEQYR